MLGKRFGKSLRLALTGGGSHASFGVASNTPEADRVTVAELDKFVRRQWEGLLSYMVGSAGGSVLQESRAISESVKRLLQAGGLVVVRGRNSSITQDGFTFVLEEVNAQVWEILVVYLELSEEVRSLLCFRLPLRSHT
jgi:transcription initiation factor TFIIH subunit 4